MVEGTINGFPFRAALEPNGEGSHWLRVNKAMHDAAGADAGDTVTVEITRAGEEPETRVPMDLRKALGAAPLAVFLASDESAWITGEVIRAAGGLVVAT